LKYNYYNFESVQSVEYLVEEMPIEASSLTDSGHIRPEHSNYVHHQNHLSRRNGQQICSNLLDSNDNKNRGRMRWIVSLGLLLPALAAIIGMFFTVIQCF
jgi:hypothetical protein